MKMYTYDYFLRQFQDAKKFIRDLDNNIEDEAFLTAPKEGKWCVAELIKHLNLTAEMYLPALRKSVDNAPDKLKYNAEPFKLRFLMRKFLNMVKPEAKKNIPTVGKLQPELQHGIDPKEIVQRFLGIQDELLNLVKKAQVEQLALDKIKFKNPTIPLLTMDVNATLAILEAHQRRHFDQMKRAIELINS